MAILRHSVANIP